jgi:hypothetical protein
MERVKQKVQKVVIEKKFNLLVLASRKVGFGACGVHRVSESESGIVCYESTATYVDHCVARMNSVRQHVSDASDTMHLMW